jgi:hypothetical protein
MQGTTGLIDPHHHGSLPRAGGETYGNEVGAQFVLDRTTTVFTLSA